MKQNNNFSFAIKVTPAGKKLGPHGRNQYKISAFLFVMSQSAFLWLWCQQRDCACDIAHKSHHPAIMGKGKQESLCWDGIFNAELNQESRRIEINDCAMCQSGRPLSLQALTCLYLAWSQFKSLLLNLELIFIFVTTDCHVLFYACVVMMRQC